MKNRKRIFYFSRKHTDGHGDMKSELGGKGANLAEMTSIGLPVPPGFTIDTLTCGEFLEAGERLPENLMDQVKKNITRLEKETGKGFGDRDMPLLVSVRSGAAVSMPGMMDTVLNLGLNDKSVEGLAKSTNNRRFALDSYRRLINMYADVVMGVAHEHFESNLEKIKKRHGAETDAELDEDALAEVIAAYKKLYKKHTKAAFPQNPYLQLEYAIKAVFASWSLPRAVEYRRIHEISGLHGTAVNIQSMVFGNMGDDSGTGVAFTRNPSTGKNELYGEFLVNAQGEDVVAGIRTPLSISEMQKWRSDIYKQLIAIKKKLEKHYRDMQDIEFTIERGKLYMLQTRTGKRTAPAAVKIAMDLVREKLIDKKTALLKVPANNLEQLLLPAFDPDAPRKVITTGLPASPGAATGKLAFTADEATARAETGEAVILVRHETSPEDVHGMHVAQGILTATGGSTSHAAVVARGWGKCCVTGAQNLEIDQKKKMAVINGHKLTADDILSIDGTSGEVILGELPRIQPGLSGDFRKLMQWADKYSRLGVYANADTPEDAKRARSLGATGIGLCRTEHMFFKPERISAMRRMILADTEEHRREALASLLPYQRRDFEQIFKAMKGLPVIVRLLDPPLHEFLPQDSKTQSALAKSMGITLKQVRARINKLHETNPMLGHRGCRLTITYPEILEMQVKAITQAAINCRRKRINAQPEIMIPLVGVARELELLREYAETAIAGVMKKTKYNGQLEIPIGTMIEVPRAALTADKIARHADFFSFGTNDLTQMTLGYSRDDVNTFLPDYIRHNIVEHSPFQHLDAEGVGPLIEMAVKKGRSENSKLQCGICGEHGGDPQSIEVLAGYGLDYVSCSPFRVPSALLAVAQAAIRKTINRGKE